MSDDGKLPFSSPASARRRAAFVTAWVLAIVFGSVASAPAAAQVTLQVVATDGLPGFHRADLAGYLAQHMAETRLADWRFEPANGNGLA